MGQCPGGINGGSTLAIPANKLTGLQVIDAINLVQRFHECPLGLHGKNLCPPDLSVLDLKSLRERSDARTT
jgi:DNA-binding IscR family transcriptional regulator